MLGTYQVYVGTYMYLLCTTWVYMGRPVYGYGMLWYMVWGLRDPIWGLFGGVWGLYGVI